MNKITCVKIEGKKYNVAMLTPQTLAEFVVDANKIKDVAAVVKKYNVVEVKL